MSVIVGKSLLKNKSVIPDASIVEDLKVVLATQGVAARYTSGPIWDREITQAVRPTTLKIKEGETLGLVGESGSCLLYTSDAADE